MTDTLSRTFAALADPTRRAILDRLRQGEASVTELAEPFLGRMTLPGVTKHLKVLEVAGLVKKGREAQWRPCHLRPAPLHDVSVWMEDYRALMEEHLDRLGEYLRSAETISSDRVPPPNAPAPSPFERDDP